MTMKTFTDIQLPDMSDAYRQVQEKAKKDYDGDGKIESGAKEHAGAVHNAIQKKKGLKPDGKDTRKEEVDRVAEATLATARKNIGRDPKKKSCWDGYKATGTKMKGGKAVPDCKKEDVEEPEAKVEEGYGKKKKKKMVTEISADLALKASKKAEVERGKAAVAGNKEKAIEKMKQSSRLYAKQAAKRRMEKAS